jgi:hypothetical protein
VSRNTLALAGALLIAGACSRSASSANRELAPALTQWTGTFQATQQQNGNVAQRGRNNATGSVTLVSSGRNSLHAKLSLAVEAPTQAYLRWALVPGRCGADALPVVAVGLFPEIAMGNGRGHVEGEVAAPLPESGSYHVNVYWTAGRDEADVMTCANLRREARKAS